MRALNTNVWKHKVSVSLPKAAQAEKVESMDSWCLDAAGKRCKWWYAYDIGMNYRVYAFKEESVLLLFKLRWGTKHD